MPLSRLLAATAAAAIGFSPSAAWAACSVAVSPVAFGTVDAAQDAHGTGEVVVRCDAAASFRVGISPGSGSGTRRMEGPDGARLDYHLFQDAGRSIPWGDDQAIGGARAGSSDGDNPTRLTIYGAIPAQPSTPGGDYTDSLQVTLTF